jgi:hypothetical protein
MVFWVQVLPPRGGGTLRLVRARARPWRLAMPSARSVSTSNANRCVVRVASSCRAKAIAAAQEGLVHRCG